MNTFEVVKFIAVYNNQEAIDEILARDRKLKLLFEGGRENYLGSFLKFTSNFAKFYLYDPETRFELFSTQEILFLTLEFLEEKAKYLPEGFTEAVGSANVEQSVLRKIKSINKWLEESDPDREQG